MKEKNQELRKKNRNEGQILGKFANMSINKQYNASKKNNAVKIRKSFWDP